MRRPSAAALLFLASCTVAPWLTLDTPPGAPIVGGIADLRPFFGTLKTSLGCDAGEFMLATCGCGDWRVLCSTRDGRQRWQFPVQFLTTSPEYDPADDVGVFGKDDEDNAAISGALSQSTGWLTGRARRGMQTFAFDAQRGESHTNDAAACVKCHVGDDPILPQPDHHPPFELNPPNCLACHQVVINE